MQEDIISEDLGSPINQIYCWETKYGFCPLMIAGVFDDRVRFRLFGPNPKYYSNFYSKDEEFVDLTTYGIYD